jgi:hypothetical protein
MLGLPDSVGAARVRRVVVVAGWVAAMLMLMAPPAQALAPPAVYVRQIGSLSEPLGPWQQLPAQVSSLGPYEIGVGIQPTSDPDNGQAVEVDLVSMPGGAAPSAWQDFDPYTPVCAGVSSGSGSIDGTGANLFFHGNGVYTLNVSVYTNAQQRAMPGNTCSGGPTSTVTLTVDAHGAITVVGRPVVPRTTLDARGFVGIQVNAPAGASGYRWRCARDPVRSADGPVTGSAVTSSSTDEFDRSDLRYDETTAFTGPGRWACSVRLLAGDLGRQAVFPTPWTTTPTFVVPGQYQRDQRRTRLTALPHGRLQMVVAATRQIAKGAAGGQLTLAIYRASCHGRRVVLGRVLQRRSRVDRRGVARFSFATPGYGFYLGRVTFGGNSLILRGRDPDDMTLVKRTSPGTFGFIDPAVWVPC